MTDSILDTIKPMLGVPVTDTAFDTDIIVGINSAFMAINQMGVGTETVFEITDNVKTWTDFLGSDLTKFSAVKTYIFLKTKLTFDPPTVGALMTSIENQILELGWRLTIQVPIPPETV